ncbi:MAG: cation:proton antiporter, partial [Candidatus Pacearchaeota archaeon]|nr:cation:proton antiporter [Candidatus Pacearchaeota archaeon]
MLEIIGNAIKSIGSELQFAAFSQSILLSVAAIIIVASFLALISKELKQQLILAYIVAGILLGPLVFGIIKEDAIIKNFAEIGIAFLLFTAGLEMNFKKIKETFGVSLLAGIAQIVMVALITFIILSCLSFGKTESLILGVAVAFSSTIVVTKILAEKDELNTLHGRFIIGIMLVQDIFAIFVLAILTEKISLFFVLNSFLRLIFIVIMALLLNYVAISFLKKASKNVELLFIISLAILFFFIILANLLELSIAIAAFVAGVSLANTPYKLEIETRTRALRDFFSVIFFVSVGLLLKSFSKDILVPTFALLIILIIIEPLVTAFLLRLKGYKEKTSIQIGLAFAQLSEFTLILTLTALGLGLVTQRAFDVIVLTTIISIAFTPYVMGLTNFFSSSIGRFLYYIKTKEKEKIEYIEPTKKTVLLVGCHRIGSVYLKNLEKYKNKILVVDFNPEIIEALMKQRISCIYGDITNKDLLQKIPYRDLRAILSTVPKKESNLLI